MPQEVNGVFITPPATPGYPIRERRTSVRNDPAFLLGILYTIIFAAFSLSPLFTSIPAENEKFISQLLPVMSMIQGGIVQYFYTRSQQAQRASSDNTIEKLASAAATTANTAELALKSPPLVTVLENGKKEQDG